MGFFGSKKGSIISDNFMLLQDVAQFKKGWSIEVALYEDHLTMKAIGSKLSPVDLSYSKITDVYHGIEAELVEKKKSVIGRALVGGALFGGVGAVVGAVSGSGTKPTKEYKTYFIISYKTAHESDAFLQFEDTRKYKGAKLAQKLKELCRFDKTEEVSEL